jgi:hypothetical protein
VSKGGLGSEAYTIIGALLRKRIPNYKYKKSGMKVNIYFGPLPQP